MNGGKPTIGPEHPAKDVVVTALTDDEEYQVDGQPMLWARKGVISRRWFVSALGIWVSCQDEAVTVDQAAEAFRASPEVIRAAVEADYWMFLSGDTIDLDGL